MSSSIRISPLPIITALMFVGTLPAKAQEGFPKLDSAVISKMEQYNIPAVSVAIVKNEKLVYAQSYGYADREKKEKASNESLYRLAQHLQTHHTSGHIETDPGKPADGKPKGVRPGFHIWK